MAHTRRSIMHAVLLAALAAALLQTATAAPKQVDLGSVTLGNIGGAEVKLSVKEQGQEVFPKASNPYDGQEYAGCEGGFCAAQDPALEREFFLAADQGKAKVVKKMLKKSALNITRNIVPDSEGLTRVVDVAMWAASYKGHHEVIKVLLEHPGVKKLYKYEDGHILDLAAANGHLNVVKLLLDHDMPVGPAAMAHAAHYNHSDIMSLLMKKPQDLKATMQAITGGGSPAMAKIVVEAMKMAEKGREVRPNEHDWKAEYVQMAVTSGNLGVLKLLLADKDYQIKWQTAQGLIAAASDTGNKEVLQLLLSQPVFQKDTEELEEAVDHALKVAAETGQEGIVDLLISKYEPLVKQHCKAAVFRAYKYGHPSIVDSLGEVCDYDKASPKIQEADWLGQVIVSARDGGSKSKQTLKGLLSHKDALKRLRKLQTQKKDPESGAPGPKQPPHPSQDPLVMAAKSGNFEAVKLLAEAVKGTRDVLCATCAAATAAKYNQTDIVYWLAKGAAKEMLNDDGNTIDPALRVVAYSMEGGNWGLVEWMISNHHSQELGPYFLPAIAQEGKIHDLNNMLEILKKLGVEKTIYYQEQVHSAKITAALAGHVDLLLKLEENSSTLDPEAHAAHEARKARAKARQQGGSEGNSFLGDVREHLEL